MLKMKPRCEKCATPTGHRDKAYICSFECTFCDACTTEMKSVCPNCSGNLVSRPQRTVTPATALWGQIKRKWMHRSG